MSTRNALATAIIEEAVEEVQRSLIDPARNWQAEHGDVRPLWFGSQVHGYITALVSRGGGAGMVLALLETVLRRDREIRRANRTTADVAERLRVAEDRARRVPELENTILRIEAELLDAREQLTGDETRKVLDLPEVPKVAVPTCDGCGTTIGWTRYIKGLSKCEGCELSANKELRS